MVVSALFASLTQPEAAVADAPKPVIPLRVTIEQMQERDRQFPGSPVAQLPANNRPHPQRVNVEKTHAPPLTISHAGSVPAGQPAAPRATLNPVRSFNAQRDDGTRYPPDSDGAIGPAHAVTLLSSGFTVKNKYGGHVLSQISLASFFFSPNPPINFPYLPRIQYDQYAHRWVATCGTNPYNNDGSFASYLCLAVSETSDPTMAWNRYVFEVFAPGHSGEWMDLPTLGIDENNIIICGDMYDYNGPFRHADVYIFDKNPLLAGSAVTLGIDYTIIHNPCGVLGSSYQSCHAYESAPDPGNPDLRNYILSEGWYDFTGIRRFIRINAVRGIGAAAFIDCPPGDADLVEVPCYNFNQADAPQKSCQPLDTLDTRLTSTAVLRVDNSGVPHLWVAHSVGAITAGCPNPAAPNSRTEVAWYEFSPVPTPTLVQAGRVNQGLLPYYYPSIAVTRERCVLLGFSTSNPDTLSGYYGSAGYTTRQPTDPPGVMEPIYVYKFGISPYQRVDNVLRNRWGNYSTACADPSDGEMLWTIQEHTDQNLPQFGTCTDASSRWSTWWVAVRCSPSPFCACPGQVIPGPVNGGQIGPCINCLLVSPFETDARGILNCGCADLDSNGLVELDDIPLFVDLLLNDSGCQ
ncbi:MAG: hypothetical protein DCC65_14045 [Planctomycetota bacterium]|nr:MAG: hypothetical protein DCC65_14045 [Planctomycetota bacterium]